jgi:Ty3 transposon capsid-like protein/Zinc knuckle
MAEFMAGNVAEAMQAMQQRLWTLEGALQQLNNNNQAQGAQQRIRPAIPEVFKGTIDSNRVRQWIFSVEIYYELIHIQEAEKVAFAISLLKENALLWWQSLEQENRPLDWDAFKKRMVAYFQPLGAVANARERLARLTQQGSVKGYIDTFRSLCLNIPELSADERLDRFKRGLKPEIRLQVAYARPATFEAAVTVAEEIDAILYTHQRSRVGARDAVPRNRDAPTPMELGAFIKTYADTVKTKGFNKDKTLPRPLLPSRKFRGLSVAEKESLRERGLCFNCRAPGHIARFCPKGQGR